MPLGCYVHIPFCAGGKCPYCAFYSIPYDKEFSNSYVDSAIAQISRECVSEVDTLYFGGGSPTSLNTEQLRTLLGGAIEKIELSASSEITVEASPETLQAEKITLLKELGVGRLSIGLQSLSNSVLCMLGRRHDSDCAKRAVASAVEKGMAISIDLIYGVPGQTFAQWDESLEYAINCGAEHVSLYCLSYEPGTLFTKRLADGVLSQMDESTEKRMFFRAVDMLGGEGLEHYELSSFARKGKRSRHNMKYWLGEGYYGIGVGAHGYSPGPPEWTRYSNISDVSAYIEGINRFGDVREVYEKLGLYQRAEEFLLLNLRLIEGFDIADIRRCLAGIEPDELIKTLSPLVEKGYLSNRAGRIAIPEEMLFVSDGVILEAANAIEAYIKNISPDEEAGEIFNRRKIEI